MLDLEYGIVIGFSRKNKYGFLKVLDQNGQQTVEEVFFHYNECRWVEIVQGEITLIHCGSGNRRPSLSRPSIGDKVAFERTPSSRHRRDKVLRWTYAAEYDRLKRLLEEV
jgi:hypothetical protein